MTQWCELDEAVAAVESGQRVFMQGAAATPSALVEALVARGEELRDVEITHLHTYGPTPYTDRALDGPLQPAGALRRREHARGGERGTRQLRPRLPLGCARAARP